VLRRFTTFTAGFVALALLLVACGGGGGEATLGKKPVSNTAPAVTVTPSSKDITYIATVKPEIAKVDVFDAPGAKTAPREFDNPWLYDPTVPTSKVPQVFLVKQQRSDGWVQVLLPVRPNGSTGWVQVADVTLTANPYRIDVALAKHTITVTKGSEVVYTGPIAIGATDPPLPDVGHPTPTPTGEYYLRVLLQAPDPNTVYGPYAYGLSSHSETLESFAGGDAEVGIHGNDDASVLGKDVTHGCIRMDNAAITMLAKQLPLGTPVSVNA
jgi:lipoprotein-anchoring transpeptidase ErfK/SrfK